MVRVGIIGATGYAGQQLVWYLNMHKNAEIKFMVSNSYVGQEFSEIYRNFKKFLDDKLIGVEDVESKIDEIDVLFMALPHGKSAPFVKLAMDKGIKAIDLGADFRLDSEEAFKEWYKDDYKHPEFIKDAVYGLPELKRREEIKNCKIIANPGCYPTASILALAPLLHNDLIEKDSIIIDAKSGVSGAGRSASIATLYTECNESIKAYGVTTHRHTAEIEQELSKIGEENIALTFTPHLVPMNRGILSVTYSKLKKDITEKEIYDLYNKFYENEYFVRVINDLPETRFVRGTNLCDIAVRVDKRTNRVIAISAIDNLIKGAAGQAIQNMNIMFGLEENDGLDILAMNP
jgi:N-acetyl-gamma-glutamyl-phosphate reductase